MSNLILLQSKYNSDTVNLRTRIKLTKAHSFTSNYLWGQVYSRKEETQKRNLTDIHKHRHWEQDQFIPHNTHISSTFPLPAIKLLGSMRGHLGWIIDLLMSVYPEPTLALSPCWYRLSLLNTALGLVLSVWNGNEPSYFWAFMPLQGDLWTSALIQTLFCTTRARYLRWDESAFIYCKRGRGSPRFKNCISERRENGKVCFYSGYSRASRAKCWLNIPEIQCE